MRIILQWFLENSTSIIKVMIAIAALGVSVASLIFAVSIALQKRNAELVKIGVEVLRVDPEKEPQVSAAREWALDLIDANSGVKFSNAARSELMKKALPTNVGFGHVTSPHPTASAVGSVSPVPASKNQ